MAKTLREIPTRSASETKPIGVAMKLEDLDVDVRSQTVAESLERVMPPPAPAARSQAAVSAPIATPQAAALVPTRASEPATAPEPQKTSEEKKKPASQMLSTPIPAALKRRLNGLRLQHSVSTAFVDRGRTERILRPSHRRRDRCGSSGARRRLRRNSG